MKLGTLKKSVCEIQWSNPRGFKSRFAHVVYQVLVKSDKGLTGSQSKSISSVVERLLDTQKVMGAIPIWTNMSSVQRIVCAAPWSYSIVG